MAYKQKYTISRLLEDKFIWHKSDFIFFWKVKNLHMGPQILSQWFMRPFVVDKVQYSCAEQYMMASKAKMFNDEDMLHKIMNTRIPSRMKTYGRQVKNFNAQKWKEERFDIVMKGNLAKFSQNESMKQFLLSTYDKVLVEASPYDRVWGIGVAEEAVAAWNPETWQGMNLLGFALMQVRDILDETDNKNK